MIRHESTALIGAALGLPLGLFVAAMVKGFCPIRAHVRAARDEPRRVRRGAVVTGLTAAIMPARRAAGLDLLRALQYD
jgi:hypothetical protein